VRARFQGGTVNRHALIHNRFQDHWFAYLDRYMVVALDWRSESPALGPFANKLGTIDCSQGGDSENRIGLRNRRLLATEMLDEGKSQKCGHSKRAKR